MQVNVTFRHVEPSDAIKQYAVDRLNRLDKFIDTAGEAHVVLSVEKFRHMADVTISFNGYNIKGAEETGDLYSAIDMVMDKLERQVKKYRGKIKKRKTGHKEESIRYTMDVISTEGEEEDSLKIVETQNESAKPMDVEEAVMQLDLTGLDFLVFKNSTTQQINVIYRRKDGHFGLIQPE